jgi:hypothetical protein
VDRRRIIDKVFEELEKSSSKHARLYEPFPTPIPSDKREERSEDVKGTVREAPRRLSQTDS